jgi:hypothetical protein
MPCGIEANCRVLQISFVVLLGPCGAAAPSNPVQRLCANREGTVSTHHACVARQSDLTQRAYPIFGSAQQQIHQE